MNKFEELTEPKEEYTSEDFSRMYIELCKKTGWQHAGIPALKPMGDLGGSIITIQFSIVPYLEEKK